ncbi:MAG: hypothetical protein ABWZ26_06045 [Candidatus Nanopelagicales bacterium]
MPLRRGPAVRVVLGAASRQPVDAYVSVETRRHPRFERNGDPRRITVQAVKWSPQADHEYLLAEAYRSVLAIADRRGARSLAVPTLSWAWPMEDMTRIALKVLHSTPTHVRDVIIATPTPASLEAWAEALART